MVRLSPSSPFHSSGSGSGSVTGSTKGLAVNLFVSVSSIIASYAKKASRISKKVIAKSSNSKLAPTCPTKLLSKMNNKAILFLHKKKVGEESDTIAEAEFGDGGVWQREIMMGDKCQPLDFPGVIYYDSNGKQVNELPLRSPRASPLPSYVYKTMK